MMHVRLLITLAIALTFYVAPASAVPEIKLIRDGAIPSGFLNSDGDWVWTIKISNSNPVPTGSSPLSTELGFTLGGSTLLSATNLSTGPTDDFGTSIPGAAIFGWEQPGDSSLPEGLQSNCPSGCSIAGNANQVFAALKSIEYTTVGPHDFIRIVTEGPSYSNLTSSLTISGAYDGKGRITENNAAGPPPAIDHDVFTGTFTRSPLPGDVNLDGDVTQPDKSIQAANFFSPLNNFKWYSGDLTGDGDITIADRNLINAYFFAPPRPVETFSSGGSASVPEPTTGSLLGIAAIGGIALPRFARRPT